VANKLYVGNLPFNATEEDVGKVFGEIGEVKSITLVTDRETGRPRGFGFVEMENASEAIDRLNGADFGGRRLVVNEARERPPRDNRGDSRNNGGGNRNRY
jgi:RNA recognition motif-containing protein